MTERQKLYNIFDDLPYALVKDLGIHDIFSQLPTIYILLLYMVRFYKIRLKSVKAWCCQPGIGNFVLTAVFWFFAKEIIFKNRYYTTDSWLKI